MKSNVMIYNRTSSGFLKFAVGGAALCAIFYLTAWASELNHNLPTKEQVAACAEFPGLLKAILGDGDLRNIGRISQNIGSEITLEPKYFNETGPNEHSLNGLYLIMNTGKIFFKQPTFRSWYLIGNTIHDGEFAPQAVAVMSFGFPTFVDCVKKSEIINSFGLPDDAFIGTPGDGDFKIIVGKGPYYLTYLIARSFPGKDYVYSLTVEQKNTAS